MPDAFREAGQWPIGAKGSWRRHSCLPRRDSSRRAWRLPHLYPPGWWLFFTGHLHGAFLSVCRNGESYAHPAASQDQSEPVCCNPGRLTALQANLILNRTGETFWQAESYTLGFVMSPSISVLRHLSKTIENNSVTFVVECECQREAATGKSASTRVSRRQTRVSAPRI